jgi:Putative endonuclease, protein of unknown function (DUF1780)
MTERDYLRQLADEAHDTVDMLSFHRKAERERRACAAFLRCLGVYFSPHELVSPESDPPDVVFRDARYEVMIVLDKGRKIHADWKEKAARRDSAQALDELVESYHPSVPVSVEETVRLVVAELGPKASHYGPKTCSQLDALVYVDYQGRHLYPLSEASVSGELQSQGWRSVCVLFPPYSHVLFASQQAPEFLRRLEGSIKQECNNPDVWFDL